LRCTSCHAQIVQGQHITVTEGTCFLCHFRPDSSGDMTELARCTHCHNPPHGAAAAGKPFDHGDVLARGVDCLNCHATAVSGNGYVPPDRCNSCHAQAAHIERYDDLEFVHQMHVTKNKVECLQCHIAILHGHEAEAEQHPDQACVTCHGGEHGAILSVWKGRLPELPEVPSEMARVGMTCNSCHVEPIHRTNDQFAPPQCTPCHAPGYDALWPTWRQPLERSIGDLEKEAQKLPAEKRAAMLNALRIYRRGNPVHNPDLLAELTREITGTLRRSEGDCAVCHPAASELAPVWNGKAVVHRTHARGSIGCQVCHETDEPRHGKLRLTTQNCSECHHRSVSATTACSECHGFQASVYEGTIPIAGGAESSLMAQAEVACTECHITEGTVIRRPDGPSCAACHDESYSDTLRVWQRQGAELLTLARQRMRDLNPESQLYKNYADLAAALGRDRSQAVHNPELFRTWMKRIEAAP
ncbi:cytochrome c family protein, partial [bacterium]|nr:cytochrome c family protein [bacterium]